MKYILFLTSLVILSSCETVKEANYAEWSGVNSSVQGIMKAFDRVTPGGGIRGKSQNGRELVSRYHPPAGDVYANATTDKVRAYTKLTILGDRRPYVLQLHYIVEQQDSSGNYRVVQRDKERAQKILKELHTFLVTRPDKDNFIDDFRPF